jgi:hypothetical protein
MNYPSREMVWVAVVTAVGYAGLALAGDTLPVPGFLSVAAGVVLPLALLFGPSVGWGAAAGVVATAVLRGSLAPTTLAVAASVLVLATLGPRLWGAVPRLSSGRPPTDRSARGLLEYAVVAAVAVATATAVVGWGYELLGAAPFHVVALPTALTLAATTLVVGPPTLLVGARFADRLPLRRPPARDSSRAVALGTVLVPLWFVAGVVVSLGFRVAQALATTTFTSRGLDWLVPMLDPALVGHGGRRVQVLLGAVALCLVTVLVTRPGAERPAERETSAGTETEKTARRGVTDR